ncbi:low molecular weight phosphotyrosine protein phosphatase [Flavobacteriaceae bacterium S0825]|uniref:low molecular weight protein-tyrosine-phosphatase n=1 Tax=Gaetbulibacter sp. S0825 TaxID=2720084 RepID=UPI00143102A4|nr:low molecular weight protein-tyrosine-phosphatase [Gaetbulibacter sp. S0825]MCK0109161.1 low molecular weight phosphotyrosine protein phosphatase [Flavobacteriaceae bacterium S0825]NIX64796.1 low molecular weight phosphotyrosine protein phosphatase [Gaetbulibacter sp. S0825]
MTKILMVCLGNICRSPLAEGILKHKFPKHNFIVESAGTSNYHIGELPDKRSIEVAKKHGIDITNQRGRQFKVSDFDEFNFIYVMDTSNYKNIIALARNDGDKKKVELILNELDNELINVPDPYYGGDSGFENVFQLLNQACDRIYIKVLKNIS